MTYLKKYLLTAFSLMFMLSFSPLANADSNPFGMTDVQSQQTQMAGNEGKCGEGKCGEGKCGDSMKKSGKCGEGKCGEGKCGDSMKKNGKCGEGKCGDSMKKNSKCGS